MLSSTFTSQVPRCVLADFGCYLRTESYLGASGCSVRVPLSILSLGGGGQQVLISSSAFFHGWNAATWLAARLQTDGVWFLSA